MFKSVYSHQIPYQGVFLGMSLLSIYEEIVRLVPNFWKPIKNNALRKKNDEVTRVTEGGNTVPMNQAELQNVKLGCTDLVTQSAFSDVSLALAQMQKKIMDMNGKIADIVNAQEELTMEKYTK